MSASAVTLQLGADVTYTGTFNTNPAITLDTDSHGTARALDITGATNLPASIALDDDVTLTMSATQANGSTVTGTGTLIVESLAATTNLSSVSASAVTLQLGADVTYTGTFNTNPAITLDTDSHGTARALDITGATNLPASIALDDDVTLTMSATQANGSTVTGAGSLAVTGAGVTTLNLSNVASDVDLSAVNTGGAIGTLTFGTIGASQTVTLTGDQASGKTITGTGSVLVEGITATTDFGNVNPSGNVTASIANGENISGSSTLGNVDNFTFVSGADARITIAQHAKVNAAAGDNTVTLNDAGTATGFTECRNIQPRGWC